MPAIEYAPRKNHYNPITRRSKERPAIQEGHKEIHQGNDERLQVVIFEFVHQVRIFQEIRNPKILMDTHKQ